MRKILFIAPAYFLFSSAWAQTSPSCLIDNGRPVPQTPEQASTSRPMGEMAILNYLKDGLYKGWCADKNIRDTGPFINKVYYGTHPAVRVYYSPTFAQWVASGRQGPVPSRSVVIKEQYPPPAARYAGQSMPPVSDWTVMIWDPASSKDGWYWGEFSSDPNSPMQFDDDQFPFNYPSASQGIYCLRCHSTATNNFTFSNLRNIQGFPGQPVIYPDDGSWRGEPLLSGAIHGRPPATAVIPAPLPANRKFLNIFTSIPGVSRGQVQTLLPETFDFLPAPPGGGNFVSSTQCQTCHAALNNKSPFGPSMFLPSHPQPANPGQVAGANVSSYTEWRWSPMGLAGRDPIFFAQLENELAFVKTLPPPKGDQAATQVTNTCMTCHGAMGKRQQDIDKGGPTDFNLGFLQLSDRADPNFKYGALARDGISCTVCHRITPDQAPPGGNALQHFLANSINGTAPLTPADKLNAPAATSTLAPYAMKNGIGIEPLQSSYIQSSRMCGTCHTINLPVLDQGIAAVHSIEQSTYLEWLNSAYQNELGTPGPNATTCQGCHMRGSFHNPAKDIDQNQLNEKVAAIQDETYPTSENQVPLDQITIKRRNDYRRHELLGLNVFLLELFKQFPDVLGVRPDDYFSGSSTVVQDTIDNFTQQAQQRTAKVDLEATRANKNGQGSITANITVTNLAGHRFPSGVGFRRAFLEVIVASKSISGQDRVWWSSGRTNGLGLILDGANNVLPSEFFTDYKDANGNTRQAFQPHYQIVNAQNQVQIYEELVQGKDGRFTTSFVRRDKTVKDNRLMPLGWSSVGPDPVSLNGVFLKATQPDGEALDDPDFLSPAGHDQIQYQISLPPNTPPNVEVRATLYYQAIPPYYLRDRFQGVPDGDATKRLYYMTSRASFQGPTASWKFKLASASVFPR